MPIDPSILFQLKQPQFQNPVDTAMTGLQLRNMMQQGQAQQLQMQDQQLGIQEKQSAVARQQLDLQHGQQIAGILQKHGGDLDEAIPEILQIPNLNPSLVKGYTDLQNGQLNNAKSKVETAGANLTLQEKRQHLADESAYVDDFFQQNANIPRTPGAVAKAKAEFGKIGATDIVPPGSTVRDLVTNQPLFTAPEKPEYEAMDVSIDGKPAKVNYDKHGHRFLDAAGNDVSARVTPKVDDQQKVIDDYNKSPEAAKYGAGPFGLEKFKAAQQVQNRIQVNVAGQQAGQGSPDEVAYWTKQVRDDPKNFGLIKSKGLQQQVSQQLASEGVDVNQIDAQTRDAAKFAQTALKHIGTINTQIDQLDKQGKLGPLMGRWGEFLAGKVGAGDPAFATLRDNIMLMDTAMGRVHGGARGGASPIMLEHFKSMLNAGTMDKATLKSGLGVFQDWLNNYAQMDKAQSPASPGSSSGDLKNLSTDELFKRLTGK